jgi:hypothetical protein
VRRALVRVHLRLEINLRHSIRALIIDLIADWSHYDTNTKHAKGLVPPILKKSEMRYNIPRHRFDCRLGQLWH